MRNTETPCKRRSRTPNEVATEPKRDEFDAETKTWSVLGSLGGPLVCILDRELVDEGQQPTRNFEAKHICGARVEEKSVEVVLLDAWSLGGTSNLQVTELRNSSTRRQICKSASDAFPKDARLLGE
jgi:hypothetical protein